MPYATAAPAQARPPAFTSPSSIALFALPAVNLLGISYCYSALPLHFLDSGWSLLHLGVVLGVGNVLRVLVTTPLTNSVGEWGIAVYLGVVAAASLVMATTSPGNEAIVAISCCLGQSANCVLAFQGLLFRRYGKDREAHRVGLRIFGITDVGGYSLGSFVGGLLYDVGGWPACAWFQFAVYFLVFVLVASMPETWADFREWREARRRGAAAAAVVAVAADEAPKIAAITPPSASPGSEKDDERRRVRVHLNAVWPVATVLFADYFLVNIAYSTEWSLFALYFRQTFNWSSSMTGLAQMAGDLFAAVILMVMACRLARKREREQQRTRIGDAAAEAASGATRRHRCGGGATTLWSRCLHHLTAMPNGMVTLLLLTAVLYGIWTLPSFAAAVVAQVLMGTVYVFGIQMVNEMLAALSFGKHRVYRRLASAARLSFDAAVSIGNFSSILIYAQVNRDLPFLLVAGACFICAAFNAAFFLLRRRRSEAIMMASSPGNGGIGGKMPVGAILSPSTSPSSSSSLAVAVTWAAREAAVLEDFARRQDPPVHLDLCLLSISTEQGKGDSNNGTRVDSGGSGGGGARGGDEHDGDESNAKKNGVAGKRAGGAAAAAVSSRAVRRPTCVDVRVLDADDGDGGSRSRK